MKMMTKSKTKNNTILVLGKLVYMFVLVIYVRHIYTDTMHCQTSQHAYKYIQYTWFEILNFYYMVRVYEELTEEKKSFSTFFFLFSIVE